MCLREETRRPLLPPRSPITEVANRRLTSFIVVIINASVFPSATRYINVEQSSIVRKRPVVNGLAGGIGEHENDLDAPIALAATRSKLRQKEREFLR